MHLASAPAADHGGSPLLRDPVLAPALAQLHAAPERKWTVTAVAAAAAVSRSVLDDRFRQLLGRSPIRYLTDWRMHVAEELLATAEHGIAAIAPQGRSRRCRARWSPAAPLRRAYASRSSSGWAIVPTVGGIGRRAPSASGGCRGDGGDRPLSLWCGMQLSKGEHERRISEPRRPTVICGGSAGEMQPKDLDQQQLRQSRGDARASGWCPDVVASAWRSVHMSSMNCHTSVRPSPASGRAAGCRRVGC